jgi:methionyl-tRNA formyltransferase
MRIVLIGQAAFGEKVLQALVDNGEEVVAVYTPPNTKEKEDPLRQLAVRLGITSFQSEKMRAQGVYEKYITLKPDLNIMAFVTDILPESILHYPKLDSIQYHPSLLPKHRGGSAINWAIIKGETRTGITIFWPDKGIDTGPILLQKTVEISPDDTVGSIYFNQLFPIGIASIIESIELIKKGKAPRIPQNESQATYEGLCTEQDAIINWSQPVTTVYNLIRGTNPQPGATTSFQGKRLKILDSAMHSNNTGIAAGEVISSTGDGFVVATKSGAIMVKRIQMPGSPKVKAAEFVQQVGLKVGDRFDS